jgi:hypothetical protein
MIERHAAGGELRRTYTTGRRELKGRQIELAVRIEQHQEGEGDHRTTLESLISVASRAADLFERSKTEQPPELIALVFSNLRLRGKKARVFTAFAVRPDGQPGGSYELAGGLGFEPRLAESESAVLPLDDPPTWDQP